jgi:hypothetical protein
MLALSVLQHDIKSACVCCHASVSSAYVQCIKMLHATRENSNSNNGHKMANTSSVPWCALRVREEVLPMSW